MKLSSVKVVETLFFFLFFFWKGGGRRKGEGCGWAALCLGCHRMPPQLFFVTQTHPTAVSTYHTRGDRRGGEKKIRAGDFVWDFPSAPYTQPSAISSPPPEDSTGCFFCNQPRILLHSAIQDLFYILCVRAYDDDMMMTYENLASGKEVLAGTLPLVLEMV